MSAASLLSRLEKVKAVGPGKWKACCPAHADRRPSLSILEKDDGRVLIHCFAGCAVHDVLSAVGADAAELFPPRPICAEGIRPERRPWIPSDVFEIARVEVSVVALISCDMHSGRRVSEQDYQRLHVAAQRLNHIAEVAYGSR